MNQDALLRQAWLALEGLERTLPSSGAALWQAAPVSRVQRLHQALERSGPIARGLMGARLAGIDLSAIWDVLISACKEIALYFGGSVLVGGVYPSMYKTYWHDCHKGPEGGGYFGYWCFEAAGAARVCGMDDSAFRDNPYYPKDLATFRKNGSA